MRTIVLKLSIAAAILVTVTLALSAGAQASRSLSLSPAGNITTTSQGLITLSQTLGVPISIACSVTLTGSLNSLIAFTAGADWGEVSGGTTSCHRNALLGQFTFTILKFADTGVQSKRKYAERLGGFPATGKRFIWDKLQILTSNAIAGRCLYQGLADILESYAATPPFASIGWRFLVPNSLPLIQDLNGGNMCARATSVSGQFNPVIPRQTLTLIN